MRFAICLLLSWIAAHPAAGADKPHILVIMADDLGWADVGYHGGSIPTPTIDALVQDSVELRHFYADSLGWRSQAVLLTGRYPFRYGFQGDVAGSAEEAGLPKAEVPLPALLKEQGYSTYLLGKWIMGFSAPEYLPLSRGYDHHLGSYSRQIDHYTKVNAPGSYSFYRDGELDYVDGWDTTLLVDEAIKVISERHADGPLFIKLSLPAPRFPFQAPQVYTARHLMEKVPRQRAYNAMVEAMDAEVGRVLARLDELGIREQTVVVFTSDNGADLEFQGSNDPLRGGKDDVYDGGMRVPAMISWPGTLEPSTITDPAHMADLHLTLAALAGAVSPDPDGVDLLPALKGGTLPSRVMPLMISTEALVLRRDKWKLVAVYAPEDEAPFEGPADQWEPTQTELFDLSLDEGEQADLSTTHPAVVQSLLAQGRTYLQKAEAPGTTRRPDTRGGGDGSTTNRKGQKAKSGQGGSSGKRGKGQDR